MGEEEGAFSVDLQTFECCNTCLGVAMDAAYSDGFQHDDDRTSIDVGEETEEDTLLSYNDLLSYRDISLNSE